MAKAQCKHSDTGLCTDCFDYEIKLIQLKEELYNLKVDYLMLSDNYAKLCQITQRLRGELTELKKKKKWWRI